jgi:hypothetical protein
LTYFEYEHFLLTLSIATIVRAWSTVKRPWPFSNTNTPLIHRLHRTQAVAKGFSLVPVSGARPSALDLTGDRTAFRLPLQPRLAVSAITTCPGRLP